jgi:hypothetical protein
MAAVGCLPNGNNVIFLQLILYFSASILGFFVTIPIGIVLRNFQGSCILFAQVVQWGTAIIFPWSETSCDFVLYVNLAINIFYATFMGALTLFMKIRRTARNPDKIGLLQDWHVSFVLAGLNPVFLFVNSLIVVMEISGASIMTAGLTKFCNYTLEYAKSVPMGANGTSPYIPTSCAGLDARWNYQWSQLRIVRGATRGVQGENFFGCLTLATIASWLLFIVWVAQLALNIAMSCRVCSCEIAEEKRKPDQSMIIAQRRSRLATPIATPGGFGTGRHTPQTFPPSQGYGPPPEGRMMPMGVGPPSRDAAYPGEQYREPGYDRAPPYRVTPPSDEEKKPLPSDDEESQAGVHEQPPPMKALPGKQVYKRNTNDSELI